ncbi:MAG: ATP-binding cassette domain-containing protein [Sedimenticolaceae bacterium]
MDNIVLSIRNVNKTFGGLHALGDINLDIEEGKIHAIIGPNGAGKSTLLNVCIGRLVPDSGTVEFDGKNMIGLKPHEINHAGMVRIFQTPEIFPDLSILQNLDDTCLLQTRWRIQIQRIHQHGSPQQY